MKRPPPPPHSPVRLLAFTVMGLAVTIGCNAILGNEEGTPRLGLGQDASTATATVAVIGDGGSLDLCDTSQGNKICFGVCVKTNQTSTGCGDPASCVACDAKNANASQCQGVSTGFVCGFDKCKDGYLDCDKNPSNGCETSSGPTHCGDCSTSCLGTPKPFCGPDPGHPGGFACLGSCPPGTIACSGTCVDTMTSTDNCGGCGKSCTKPGYTASCVGSSCVFACPSGTHDCSGTCVSPIDTNACGPSCLACPSNATIHVVARCNADGTCGTICETNYHDCDGNTANGCETFGTCPIGTSSGSTTTTSSSTTSGSTSGCTCTSGGAQTASIQPLGGIPCLCPVSMPVE